MRGSIGRRSGMYISDHRAMYIDIYLPSCTYLRMILTQILLNPTAFLPPPTTAPIHPPSLKPSLTQRAVNILTSQVAVSCRDAWEMCRQLAFRVYVPVRTSAMELPGS